MRHLRDVRMAAMMAIASAICDVAIWYSRWVRRRQINHGLAAWVADGLAVLALRSLAAVVHQSKRDLIAEVEDYLRQQYQAALADYWRAERLARLQAGDRRL